MPKFENLSDVDIRSIANTLRRGNYYLFLGSGVSLDSIGKKGPMPSVSDLEASLSISAKVGRTRSLHQVYPLLTPEDVSDFLTDPYTCVQPGQTAKALAGHAWRQIFTLNIDDAIETASVELSSQQRFIQKFIPKHFSDDFIERKSEDECIVAHLHGSVKQPGRGYVFSHNEYARSISRTGTWTNTFAQLLASEPFIVSGTSMNEIDVAYYLEQRGARPTRTDVAPSVLIEPFPDRITEHFCDTNHLHLFTGTTLEFFNALKKMSGIDIDVIDVYPEKSFSIFKEDLSPKEAISFFSTFSPIEDAPEREKNPFSFYIGAEPTWGTIAENIDIPRDMTLDLLDQIYEFSKSNDERLLLVLDQPASGKSTLLKRVAAEVNKAGYKSLEFVEHSNVDDDIIIDLLSRAEKPLLVFVDNFADTVSRIRPILDELRDEPIYFIAFERTYRESFLENALSGENFLQIKNQVAFSEAEASKLITAMHRAGLTNIGKLYPGRSDELARDIAGEEIGIATCRVRGNFKPFDRIVRELITDSDRSTFKSYLFAALARFCFGGGVHSSIIHSDSDIPVSELLDPSNPLSLQYTNRRKGYVVPYNAVIADRCLFIMKQNNDPRLFNAFVNLSKAIAPRVSRATIRNKSPESRISGRLLDYDQVVREFLGDQSERFYREIKDEWDWNARYWEQLSLLKLDWYLSDRSDTILIEQSVQHAQHAVSLERHPLSYTTLAKILFHYQDVEGIDRDLVFSDSWNYIMSAVDIEKKWDNIRNTVFIIAFNGVIRYLQGGGLLNGKQTEQLKDVVAITHARRLRGKDLFEKRQLALDAAGCESREADQR